MPKVGYGSAKNTKHMLPNGFRKVVVNNVKVCSFLSKWFLGLCLCPVVIGSRYLYGRLLERLMGN